MESNHEIDGALVLPGTTQEGEEFEPELDAESTAQRISQIAADAEQRAERTKQELQKKQPDFIVAIEHSEVVYRIHPNELRLRYVDFESLCKMFAQRWGLLFDDSTLQLDLLPGHIHRGKIGELTTAEIVQLLLRDHRAAVSFVSGKYPISEHDFVPIRKVTITTEAIFVVVAGIARVAEDVAKEVFEIVALSSGAHRRWKDVDDKLQNVNYATRTKVDLGMAFESLLDDRIVGFLDDELVSGTKYGAHMAGYDEREGIAVSNEVQCTYALDDVIFRVSGMSTLTGNTFTVPIKLSVMRVGDYRSGLVSVSSSLPFEVHVEFVGALIQSLHGSP